MSSELLDALEERIREASEKLRSLREENSRLREQVAGLEERLAEAASQPEAAAWAQEREEVHRRLQGLTKNLEKLLASG